MEPELNFSYENFNLSEADVVSALNNLNMALALQAQIVVDAIAR
jgi:hypothetical protein